MVISILHGEAHRFYHGEPGVPLKAFAGQGKSGFSRKALRKLEQPGIIRTSCSACTAFKK
jgi:hypothetical protein